MDSIAENKDQRRSRLVINLISIIVPVVVAVLLAFPNKIDLGLWTKSIPHIIGSLNTLTSITLILGLIFIKQNKIELHRLAMLSSFALGGVFLICYVTYHISNPSNKFNGEGIARFLYLAVLVTHILCSLVVLPMVLRALFYALTKQFARHKKIVKFAYPIWLYVSVTGVIVYLMLYQLFPPT